LVFGTAQVGGATALAAIAVSSGAAKWLVPVVGFVRGYLASDGTVIVGQYGDKHSIYGMDAQTQEVRWSISEASTCDLQFPVGDDGTMVCYGGTSGASVGHIQAEASGTPVAAETPVPVFDADGPQVVNADPTGGGAFRGLPISDGPYQQLWSAPDHLQPGDPFRTVFRYSVFSTGSPGADELVTLTSRDLLTGRILWTTSIAAFTPYVVTSEGVVAVVTDPFDPATLRLGILDLNTGQLNQLSTVAVARPTDWGQLQILIVGKAIVVADSSGHVSATDFQTGLPLWTYDYERTLAAGLTGTFPCSPVNSCLRRDAANPSLVSDGTTLYIGDNVTANVTALDLQTGAVRWQKSMLDSIPAAQFGSIYVVATPRGPLVFHGITAVNGNPPHGSMALWSADTGSVIWSNNSIIGVNFPALTDHDTFFLAASPSSITGSPVPADEECCVIAEFSLSDGSLLWQQADDNLRLIIGYLPDWDTLITVGEGDAIPASTTKDGATPVTNVRHIQGMTTTTHEIAWDFVPDWLDCAQVVFPVGPAGALLCLSTTNQESVYAPVPATEINATPVATPALADRNSP